MVRNRKWSSFIIAAIVLLQFVVGGLAVEPMRVKADAAGPVLTSKSPSASATNVRPDTSLLLTFDQNVKKGTGGATIQIRKQISNELVESFDTANSGRVAIGTGSNRNVVTITPTSSFALNTSYYVTIDPGAFVSESDNSVFTGLTSALDWSFTTIASVDTTNPVLDTNTPLQPANNATVGISTGLKMKFNKPVFAASGTITVTNTNPRQSWDSQAINVNSTNVSGSSTSTITIVLPNSLQGSSEYTVSIPNGAFKDAAGNPFMNAPAWTFKTSAPPLGSPTLSPQDDAYGVSVSTPLVLSFPVKVAKNSGYIWINKIADNTSVQQINVASSSVVLANNAIGGTDVTITPSTLDPNTGFYVLIDANAFKGATDASLLYQGISDARYWSFSTNPGNDQTPPTLVADQRKPLATQATLTPELELNFSEPVYPGTGNITIRSYPSGSVFAAIPVTSTSVTGGGTTKIKVGNVNKTYTNNTTYYVEIGGQAFSDASGNYYAGITGDSGWRFTVTSDTDKPTLVLQLPANGATNVPLQGAKLEATFSEPIMLGTNTSAIKLKRISGSTASIATTFAIDPTNNRKLLITVNGTLTASTDYYVEMGAGVVTDLAGNAFDGILNQYQWTFRTSSTTSGPPKVSKAELVGTNKIRMTFNENLNENVTPLPANFYVTVNGAMRVVSAVAVSGQYVTLTLQSDVAAGQTVKVSYSAGTAPIQDLSGIEAANFSNLNVTNVADTTAPYQVSGSINGNTVILTFSEELASISTYAYSQFSLNINGSYSSVTSISGSGNLVVLTYGGQAATIGQTVSVSYYSSSSYALKDLAGNALASFSGFYIQNGYDAKAPALQSATASGAQITLGYDEALNPSLIPPRTAYALSVNGKSRSVSGVSVGGAQVVLTVSPAIAVGDSVLLSYTVGSPALSDLGGNAALAFNGTAVNTGTGGSSALALNGIIAKGANVTLSFSAELNTGYVPTISQFAVKVNNVSRPILNTAISGSTVVLTLATAINIGDTVKVSYTNSGYGPRSTTGAVPASFTDTAAANQTTWSDGVNSEYEAAAGGGLSIKISEAATTSAVSPAGISAKQYALTSEKVTNAYNAIRSVSGTAPRLVLTIPDTENAAIAAFPLGALEDAKKLTSNASIVVAYKTITYEIPLGALNFTQLAQMMNAGSAVGQLVISIDTNASSLASSLNTQLSAAKAQTLVSPVSFQVSVTNNGLTKPVETLNGYVTRTITTSANLDGRQVAVVWLDPQSGKLSYVPTTVQQVNNQSVVTFKRKGNSVYAVVKGATSFTDLNNHWARNDILLLANKYIVEGSTLTTFAPKKAITRGEFAMFIAKGLGLTGDRAAAAKFKDVNTSTSLAAYIGAAATAGIVQGMTDGSFKPNNPVTREEMATMMVRAIGVAGIQVTLQGSAADTLKKFSDRGKVGTWAQTDVAKAVQAGIINGQTTSTFGGKNNATRAEAAVMVKRLLDYVGFLDS